MVSCSDFMTEDNPNYASADVYPMNLEETDLTLNAVYNALFEEYLLTIKEANLTADMAYPGYGRNNNPTDETLASFYYHTFAASSDAVTEKWAALYAGIWRANQAIYYLERLDEEYHQTDEWYTQMAQARLLRGLFHFYLHSVYNEGDIIIFDFLPTESTDFAQPLTPSQDVITFFREDFAYGIEYLPEEYDDSADKFRTTKGFANTLMGLTLVYEGEFAEAKPYLEAVINSDIYELEDASVLFTTDGEFCSESIFEINYSEGLKAELLLTSDQIVTHNLGRDAQNFTPPAYIVDEFQCEVLDTQDPRNEVDGYANPDNLRPRSVSLRASAMIACLQDEDTRYYDSEMTTEGVTSNLQGRIGVYRKYIYWDQDDESTAGDDTRRSGKNIIVNRLSEVYLLYAEVLLEEGNVSGAQEYINKIRERWGLRLIGESNGDVSHDYDEVVYNAESLMTHLREIEKPLELVVEGHFIRNIDLRRWGIYKARYEQLSQQTYYLSTYFYYDKDDRYEEGAAEVSQKSEDGWVRKIAEKANDYYYSSANEITDYINTVNYFNESTMWWPIPTIEETTNGNLYNVVPKK